MQFRVGLALRISKFHPSSLSFPQCFLTAFVQPTHTIPIYRIQQCIRVRNHQIKNTISRGKPLNVRQCLFALIVPIVEAVFFDLQCGGSLMVKNRDRLLKGDLVLFTTLHHRDQQSKNRNLKTHSPHAPIFSLAEQPGCYRAVFFCISFPSRSEIFVTTDKLQSFRIVHSGGFFIN